MSDQQNLPVVVIVGRPNVGKSTLFNLLTGSRRSIVGDEPGITRDRIHGIAEHRGRLFEVIDTGGIIPDDDQLIPSEILKQARVAIERAAHIVFLIDGRTEITAPDLDLAKLLRQTGKPVSLAVNKIDAAVREDLAHEFHSLGFADLFPISAEHRNGIEELLDRATEGFPQRDLSDVALPLRIRVAIIGRPNAGKSTLLNALAGYERSIVTPEAGTTRDAVDEAVRRDGIEYVFVDTAGIRRKGKTKLMAEKLSVVMARKHIDIADVVLVITDATEGVVALDATIAGYAHEAGKPVIICVNKWDLAEDKNKARGAQRVRDALRYLDYAPVAFLSARSGAGVQQLFGMIRRGWEASRKRVSTGELNRFFEKLEKDETFKIRYLTQVSISPPTFVVFKDNEKPLHFSLERFLVNRIREKFGFEGTPIVLRARVKAQKAKLQKARR
jgi:GTP-binding protein